MVFANMIGNLGRDAESVKATTGGGCTFSVAVSQGWGEKKVTNWVRVTFWGKRAEILLPMLVKGTRVHLNGELQTNEYNGKTSLNLRAVEVQLLSQSQTTEDNEKTSVKPRAVGGPLRQTQNSNFDEEITYDDTTPF